MASTLRFDNWEDANGNSLASLNENGTMSMPGLVVPASQVSSMPSPSVIRYNDILRNNITVSNTTGLLYTDDISSYVTPETFAVIMSIGYQHGGSTNHGYLSGYFVQSGQDGSSSNRGYWSEAHYDWYYNSVEREIVIPWNSSGSNNLETHATSSYNTNTNNYYRTRIKGVMNYG